ncbi:hypothetical protein [Longirhabdus pacifica]|uniref:hypothetical protein n=1 Tax=Longirhabdus pacifica TaxID=2305227 RepID=UPI0010087C3C
MSMRRFRRAYCYVYSLRTQFKRKGAAVSFEKSGPCFNFCRGFNCLTAKVDGVYKITYNTTSRAANSRNKARYKVTVNGKTVPGSTYATFLDNDPLINYSGQVVVKLKRGDVVKLINVAGVTLTKNKKGDVTASLAINKL